MKIVLTNSPLQDYGKTKKRNYYTTPPLGLGYLGTIAKQQGCEVKLIDAEALGLSPKETARLTKKEKPDVVGINLTTPTLLISRKIIQQLQHPKQHQNKQQLLKLQLQIKQLNQQLTKLQKVNQQELLEE